MAKLYYTYNPPNKLYKGKKRLALKRIKPRRDYLNWLVSVRPNDQIKTFDGTQTVNSIQYVWANEGGFKRLHPNKTYFLLEIHYHCHNNKVYIGDGFTGPDPIN